MNSNKKYDYYKNSLYYLIANVVVLLVGIIVMAVCGFNYATTIQPGSLLFTCSLSIIVSLAVIYLYIGLRYDFAKAFSIVLVCVHNVLLSTATIAIIRVPVTEALAMGYILLVGLSAIFTLIQTEKLKDVNLKKADYNKVIKGSIKDSVKLIAILSAIVVSILLLSLLIASKDMFALARIFFVMMLVIIYSYFTISLPFWCYFSSKIKKVKRAKIDENVDVQKVAKAVNIDDEQQLPKQDNQTSN